MSFINFAAREINCKIVYYGAGLGGKTTNLQVIYQKTADQQKGNGSDLQITQQIRQAILRDKSLSTYAHNIKIITQNGQVTLKGPVRSDDGVVNLNVSDLTADNFGDPWGQNRGWTNETGRSDGVNGNGWVVTQLPSLRQQISGLCLVVTQLAGGEGAYVALTIGVFNSIMFPTIFTLTLERSSASAAGTSGLLCMAIIGGAILPQLAGRVADAAGLHAAYLVPMAAYIVITVFAMSAAKARVVDAGQPAGTVAH